MASKRLARAVLSTTCPARGGSKRAQPPSASGQKTRELEGEGAELVNHPGGDEIVAGLPFGSSVLLTSHECERRLSHRQQRSSRKGSNLRPPAPPRILRHQTQNGFGNEIEEIVTTRKGFNPVELIRYL